MLDVGFGAMGVSFRGFAVGAIQQRQVLYRAYSFYLQRLSGLGLR